MISYGIMQGRLTPMKGRGIQFFPFDNWQNEFYWCQRLSLDEIEWIMNYDRYQENPLWTKEGIESVKKVISESSVMVRSVCFDYFMRRPFFKAKEDERNEILSENLMFVKRTAEAMEEIGAKLLEIPFVDDSSIKTDEEEKLAIDFLSQILEITKPLGIDVDCETDLPVGKFREFLESIHGEIYANYDSGNSSGLGYDHEAEIKSLAGLIANVHIKDRLLHGTTVQLGTGSADFDKVFSSLKFVEYNKSVLLQAARGVDGDEENNIRNQITFVKDYCHRYGLE